MGRFHAEECPAEPKRAPDPGEQLEPSDRLADEIVGAGVQTGDDIGEGRPASEQAPVVRAASRPVEQTQQVTRSAPEAAIWAEVEAEPSSTSTTQ
jgi:hypothetical protein